jgi:oligoribonuclease (3'-5' exoribonuclease)
MNESDITYKYFFRALEYNTTLQKIGIFDVDTDMEYCLTDETKESIMESLEYNDTVISLLKKWFPKSTQINT